MSSVGLYLLPHLWQSLLSNVTDFRMAGPQALEDFPVSGSCESTVTQMCASRSGFTRLMGIHSQVFMLLKQRFYPLNQLCRFSILCQLLNVYRRHCWDNCEIFIEAICYFCVCVNVLVMILLFGYVEVCQHLREHLHLILKWFKHGEKPGGGGT